MTDLALLPPRESAVELCERALRDAILDGVFAPGDRLPPERALAEQLGVNRTTLRAALSRLEASRLVSVRQGSGTLVRDTWREAGPDLLPLLAERARVRGGSSIFARDVLRIRRHLAKAVLEALVHTIDADGRAAIGAAIDAFEAAIPSGRIDRIAEADLGISAALVAATGSPVLRLCLNPVLALVLDMPVLRDAMYRDPHANLAGWRALQGWLEAPDPAQVAALGALLDARDAATLAVIEAADCGGAS